MNFYHFFAFADLEHQVIRKPFANLRAVTFGHREKLFFIIGFQSFGKVQIEVGAQLPIAARKDAAAQLRS